MSNFQYIKNIGIALSGKGFKITGMKLLITLEVKHLVLLT